ncbi:MAG: alpha-ketoacid dehydrogenase subunit beta [Euryarchaeota archaeon]|nr:alpha-ketoacid dehydrogenase subunit beta [Euryarchaeota archaeon]MDE2045011.1 alpha-ketoacid dehydrogenase subunit beta [Thermoplasmata archaeon]
MTEATLIQAVNKALHHAMKVDPDVLCLGEDIGVNGGVFRATEGLQKEFGESRVLDTPLNESGIVGMAVGMALYGLKPVAEIQFLDFIYPAFDQIVSELTKFRYRSGGQFPAHVVIRTPYGGGIRGGLYHSQSTEQLFASTPGIKVVVPSTPADAKGLLLTAIFDEDPVLFMEPKRIYRTATGEVPEGDHRVPFGKARIVREGSDVSVFAYGSMVPTAFQARQVLEKTGIHAELVDLRTLVPLDVDAVVRSVEKTGRAVIVHEAPKFCGFGAELAAILAEKALYSLKAPIVRVTGYDTPFPYTLENLYLPSVDRIGRAIQRTVAAG